MEEEKVNIQNDKGEAEKGIKDGGMLESLEKCEKERDEYLNGWKRAKADLENYKKEEAGRAEFAIKFANLNILRDLLTIMDSFDLALIHEKDNKGLILIKTQMENFLAKNGVVAIESLGKKFDPRFHESMGEAGVREEAGIVVEEIERGWIMYEKVVRPARVRISK